MTDKQLSKQTTASKHLPVRMPQASQSAASELTSHELQAAVENPAGAPPAHLLALQRKFGNRAVGKAIQRAAAVGMEGGAVDTRTHSAIQSERGGGAPLDANVGAQVGNALGADFSGVKVHTDAKADSLNRTLSATAFTLGSDIFFSQGAYSPGTSGGQELLAHELTHVVQQGGGSRNKVQAKLTVGAAGDRYEQEADRFASKFSKRTSATPAVSTYAVARAPAGYRSGPGKQLARKVSAATAGAAGAAPAGVIQRKIGFEFEGNFKTHLFFPDKNNGKAITDDQKEGRTKATPPGEALKPIAKGTALATGGRFEVQADELPSGLSDLEFVTTLPPFDETPSERDALKQTMARMLQGSPQATIAMRRDRVNQFMQDTGAPKDNPDPQLQAGREDLMGMSPKDSEIASRAASRTLKAIEVYRNTIKQQKNQDDFDVQIGSNELVGLVTLLATYLIRGDEEKLSYAKNITIMLARTDFATMFKQLTAQGQKHFKASGGQPFVELVLSAAGLAGTDDVAVFKQGLNYADKGGKTHRKSRRG